MEITLLVILVVFFLSIGSLSSMLIYRLPHMDSDKSLNLFFPRSHCPSCNIVITPKYLIPLIGYMLQFGRCSNCKNKISKKYVLHELMHLIAGISLYLALGISAESIVIYFIFFLFYVLLHCDLENFYLPFSFNLLISITGIIYIIVSNDTKSISLIAFNESLIGFLLGFFSLWSVNYIYRLIKKKNGIGGGDFLLLGGMGIMIGPFGIPILILFGSLITLIIGLIDKKTFKEQLPLGSGLIIAFFIYIICNYFELFLFSYVI